MRKAAPAPTALVTTEAELEELVLELTLADEYAIDTEFHRERTYYPHLALVQIAWKGGLKLVDPLAVDVRPLSRAFASGGVAVLHAADQDLEVLERACGVLPGRIFDTQLCAGFLGYVSPSLVSLVESLLRVRLHKGDQLTDWTRRPLSDNQMSYAAGDVAYLLELREVISARLEESGRTEWASEECALLLGKPRGEGDPEEAWWRLPHSRQLRGPARAVAQTIASWRERRARQLDLPVRFILSDLAVVSLAQRPPATTEELVRTRGIEGRQFGGATGDDLLEAVRRGKALPASQLRLPALPPSERPNKPVISLASAYVGQKSSELSIDPAILATRADLVAFFQSQPSGRLASGWRRKLIGEVLEQLAEGNAALAFDGSGGLVLEERSHRPLDGRPAADEASP